MKPTTQRHSYITLRLITSEIWVKLDYSSKCRVNKNRTWIREWHAWPNVLASVYAKCVTFGRYVEHEV